MTQSKVPTFVNSALVEMTLLSSQDFKRLGSVCTNHVESNKLEFVIWFNPYNIYIYFINDMCSYEYQL